MRNDILPVTADKAEEINNTPSIEDRLIAKMGGWENFKNSWRWRSFDGEQRAKTALEAATTTYHDGLSELSALGATVEQTEIWIERFIKKWLAYQQAGSRTANPMITGPANFPVSRNRKAMEIEIKRLDEYLLHAQGAKYFMSRIKNAEERAAKSEAAKNIKHKTTQHGPVTAVYNKTLERLQLKFPDKPSDHERAILKKSAFRWSPREGAWQRKLTGNAINAAGRALVAMGHIKAMNEVSHL